MCLPRNKRPPVAHAQVFASSQADILTQSMYLSGGIRYFSKRARHGAPRRCTRLGKVKALSNLILFPDVDHNRLSIRPEPARRKCIIKIRRNIAVFCYTRTSYTCCSNTAARTADTQVSEVLSILQQQSHCSEVTFASSQIFLGSGANDAIFCGQRVQNYQHLTRTCISAAADLVFFFYKLFHHTEFAAAEMQNQPSSSPRAQKIP